MIEPFEIPSFRQAALDLRRRLRDTRWNDAVTSDWSYGTERGWLQSLVAYWANDYDWSARRAALNRLPQFRASIDGYGIHFVHVRSRSANAIPLLLMNGWPSSFVAARPRAGAESPGRTALQRAALHAHAPRRPLPGLGGP